MTHSALRNLPKEAQDARRARIGQAPAVPQDYSGRDLTGELLSAASLATAPVPVLGDLTGLAADARMYQMRPEERTMGNYAMSALGVLPFVPSVAATKAAVRAADAVKELAKRGVNISQEVRQQRKLEGGFVPTTGYHGTSTYKSGGQLFDEFQLFEGDDLTRSVSRSPVGKLGVSIGHQPEVASDFAYQASPNGNEGATIMPLTFRSDKSGTINLSGDETNDEIYGTVVDSWKNGYDAIHFKNYTTPSGTKGSFTLVKDPAQVRSVNAAFDPAKRNSRDLMAGVAATGIGLSALRNINRKEQPTD
jgi:hypothetical protein